MKWPAASWVLRRVHTTCERREWASRPRVVPACALVQWWHSRLMQRLCTLVPAALLTTAVMSPAVAVCAWVVLVGAANVVHFSADRSVARSLVIAAAITAPLLCLAAVSAPLGLAVAAVLVVASVVGNSTVAA